MEVVETAAGVEWDQVKWIPRDVITTGRKEEKYTLFFLKKKKKKLDHTAQILFNILHQKYFLHQKCWRKYYSSIVHEMFVLNVLLIMVWCINNGIILKYDVLCLPLVASHTNDYQS